MYSDVQRLIDNINNSYCFIKNIPKWSWLFTLFTAIPGSDFGRRSRPLLGWALSDSGSHFALGMCKCHHFDTTRVNANVWPMSWYHCENSFLLTDSGQGPQSPQRSVNHTWRISAVAQDSSLRCLSFCSLWVTCPGEFALGSSRRSGNTLVLQSSLVGATLLSTMVGSKCYFWGSLS